MYLIGIDFGHGETTASCIDSEHPEKGVYRLHILDGDSAESNKVASAVCRDRETGEWRFITDFTDYSCPDFFVHFKAAMNEITDSNKVAFAAFVRLVFEHVLQNQGYLEYDSVTKQHNFSIFAACPSDWTTDNDGQIRAYKDFLSETVPVEWIIRESDAAYFKFSTEKSIKKSSVLVIDIGSSTIDFTYYRNDGTKPDFYGRKLGASFVERDICKYFLDNAMFQAAQNEAIEPCRLNSINWLNGVKHYVKGQKEEFYTKKAKGLRLNLYNSDFHSSLSLPIFRNTTLSREILENTVLSGYREKLKKEFDIVKKRFGNPQIVILTGGASRMPWLQRLVEDCFPSSTHHRDPEPSYVVSDGIAYYAKALYELRVKIEEIIITFWDTYTDEKLAEMINDAYNCSLNSIRLPKIKEICDSFANGTLKLNYQEYTQINGLKEQPSPNDDGKCCTGAFVPAIKRLYDEIISNNTEGISGEIIDKMNNTLKAELQEKLREAFNAALDFIPEINLQISVAIDLRSVVVYSTDDIEKLLNKTYDFFCTWKNWLKGKPFKERSKTSERKEFANKLYDIQEQRPPEKLPEDVIMEVVSSIKNSIDEELTVEKMLNKCIFSIY